MQKDLTKENSITGKNNSKSKILVLGFVIFVLLGIFSPTTKVHAATCSSINDGGPYEYECTEAQRTAQTTGSAAEGTVKLDAAVAEKKKSDLKGSAFENEVDKKKCAILNPGEAMVGNATFDACLLTLFFPLFYQIPAYLLGQAAFFFNILISVTLSSTLLKDTFVSDAWGVVRDLSNIFFILILLYISIKIILGMGGSEVKKMIGSVVIMALLINFSMFFTQIIIDSSNILALIFYNKISVTTKVAGQTAERPYPSVGGEKDVAGGMVAAFNPTTILSPEFLKQAKIQYDEKGNPRTPVDTEVPVITLVALTLLSGVIMCIAIYALVVSGLSFLGRLIELWILIIFSPFAFMSYTVPKFASIDYLGWDAWFKRLIKVSFMAPIFMFLLYFIFMLIRSNLFTKLIQPSTGTNDAAGAIKMLLGVAMPAIFICILLLKATEFAKKGSGQIGEAVMSSAKMAGGLAIGSAALGTAFAGRKTIGAFMKGASTGDSANQRFARGEIMRDRWDTLKGMAGHYGTVGLLTKAQQTVGTKINTDQTRVEGYTHARSELDKATEARFHGKKFNDLTQTEKDTIRERVSRDHEGRAQHGKAYNDLNAGQKATVDAAVTPQLAGRTSHADDLIKKAQGKQGIVSSVVQSSRNGSYDIRNLANVIAKEQSTSLAKILSGTTGIIASGIRGGFKQMGMNYGAGQGAFFKDLGNTISEALKNAKINVDLSHVGEQKKEDKH